LKYGNEPIKVESVNGQPASLTQSVLEKLQTSDEPLPEGYINEAAQELQKYDLTNMTLKQADALRSRLIKENRATMSQNSWNVTDAYAKDPKFAARAELYDTLRDGIHGTLDDLGVKGSEGLRQDQAAMIRIKNAADAAIRSGEVVKKGSSPTTGTRQVIGKAVKKTGGALGALIGSAIPVPGAIEGGVLAGNYLGEKLGKAISPADITRNELAVRALENLQQTHAKPSLDLSGSQEPTTQAPVHPRENSPLHTELTHYYDENVGDSTYAELESRFMRDYERKIQMGLKKDITTPESNIHKQVVQERFNELKAAQDAADKAIEEVKQRQANESSKRAAVAKKVASEPVPGSTPEPKVEGQEEAPKTKKPTGSPAMEASQSVQDVEGMSAQAKHKMMEHELAHHTVAHFEGVKSSDILSDQHPDLAGTDAAAQIGYQERPIVTDEKAMESATPEQILEDTRKWAAIHLAGPAVDELNGTPFEENQGARGDIQRVKELFEAAGLTDPDLQGIEIARGIERAMDHLTQGGVHDRIKVEARAREEGLLNTHHFSAGRLEAIRGVLDNERSENGVPPNTSKGNGRAKPSDKGSSAPGSKAPGGDKKGQEDGASEEVPKDGKGVETSNQSRVPFKEGRNAPQERSTGDEATDKAIRAGGGVPRGLAGRNALEGVRLFDDPTTGTTLGFGPGQEATPEAVKAMMAESREQYLKAHPEESRVPTKGQPGYEPEGAEK
jgi:hypothetical protein